MLFRSSPGFLVRVNVTDGHGSRVLPRVAFGVAFGAIWGPKGSLFHPKDVLIVPSLPLNGAELSHPNATEPGYPLYQKDRMAPLQSRDF